jgi:DNA-binding transcriptional MocR family regulator
MDRHESALDDYVQRNRYVLSDMASGPVCCQLSRLLERCIFERHLYSTDRFPSERAIAPTFSVATPAVEHAARELLDRGFAYTSKDESVACMTSYVHEGIPFQFAPRCDAGAGPRTARTFSETVEYDEGRRQ